MKGERMVLGIVQNEDGNDIVLLPGDADMHPHIGDDGTDCRAGMLKRRLWQQLIVLTRRIQYN